MHYATWGLYFDHFLGDPRFIEIFWGAPPMGRQLYFTFRVFQTLYSKCQQHPFLRVATLSGAPRQAPLEGWRCKYWSPHFGVGRRGSPRFVLICSDFPVFLRSDLRSLFWGICSNLFHAKYDWTTVVPDNGRVAPRSHPLRPLGFYFV